MLVLAQVLFAVVLSRLPVLLRLRFYPQLRGHDVPLRHHGHGARQGARVLPG